jgi:RND family efflux transporter MFP subunit
MKNKKTIIIIAAVVALAVIITIARLATASSGSVKEVDITKAVKKDLMQSITVTGNIEANNKEDIVLSNVQKVTEVLATEGQQVSIGTVIAKVDTKDYTYQLQKAQMNYEVAKLNYNNLVNFKSASNKKSVENAVQQAQINLDSTKANLVDAQTKQSQSQELFKSGAISSQEYDASVKAVSDLANQVKLAEIQLENAKRNLSDYFADNKSQVEQLARQLESAKADIDNMADKVNTGEIKANINGKIVKLNVKPNQYPTQENNIISIYDLSQYKVTVSVSQYDAVQLSNGQRTVIKVKGLDKGYEGTVTNIGEAAEISITGTNKEAKVDVDVVISNPDDKIKAGYEADVEIILMETKQAIAINFEALQKDKEDKSFVYVVENNKAVKRLVTTGTETEFDIQILEGLKENESFIKNPPASLKEGDKVKAAGGK